jgi:hypothetical protein
MTRPDTHWTRQSMLSCHRSRPPLPLSSRTLTHHHTRTSPDTRHWLRVHRCRHHDRNSAATVLQGRRPLLHALVHHSPCHQAHQYRLGIAYPLRTCPCPFAARIAGAMDDLHGHPQHMRATINRASPAPPSPHNTCSPPSPRSPRPLLHLDKALVSSNCTGDRRSP